MSHDGKIFTEGVPMEGPMPLWLFRERITGGPTRFLRSACCYAPVWQTHEPEPDLFPVVCGACGQELAAPGREDLGRPPEVLSAWPSSQPEALEAACDYIAARVRGF